MTDKEPTPEELRHKEILDAIEGARNAIVAAIVVVGSMLTLVVLKIL